MTPRPSAPLSLALDLGTTRIKAAGLADDGRLTAPVAVPAPPLTHEDPIHEGDLDAYLDVAEKVLGQILKGCPPGMPVAIASQRSSFALWDKNNGQPVSALISWQDRRAASWCQQHSQAYGTLQSTTGLPLSPHYAGTKLVHMLTTDGRLRQRAEENQLCFGTLETALIWRLTRDRLHQTDMSMAGRTLLADIRTGQWSDGLLAFLGVPLGMLPDLVPTAGLDLPLLPGGRLKASLADQAAMLIAVTARSESAIAVNLGTGGFVMAWLGVRPAAMPGYLTGPVLQRPGGGMDYALEGTINAIGPALDRCPGPAPVLGEDDPCPDLFCLPDSAGVGAPYWRADMGFTLSRRRDALSSGMLRRTIMEGIVFRVCQIVADFQRVIPAKTLVASGGLAAEPFIIQGLAACSGMNTFASMEKELTLWGAASLAAPRSVDPPPAQPVVLANGQGRYLKAKYRRWKNWMAAQIRHTVH